MNLELITSGHRDRIKRIASSLLASREGTEDWGEISRFRDGQCPKSVANEFLLCCLLDWQMPADVAWRNGIRLVKTILGDPSDIWLEISSCPEAEWKTKWREYSLHRFPAGHNRLWPIAKRMSAQYGGDAGNIWRGKQPSRVLDELWALGAGEQISRMIVGALRDCGQVVGSSDVKADVHVCRVLGRAVYGAPIDPSTATELTRVMCADDPWQLDWPIWNLGKSYCKKNSPNCVDCSLRGDCAYANKLPLGE